MGSASGELDVSLIILGWLLGIVSGFLIPEIRRIIIEKRNIAVFKKELKLEIRTLRSILDSGVNSLKDYYEITSTEKEEFSVALANKKPPLIMNRNYRTYIYRTKSNQFVSLDQSLQEKIYLFYNGVESLNSILLFYTSLLPEHTGVKMDIVKIYFEVLIKALNEANEILSEFS